MRTAPASPLMKVCCLAIRQWDKPGRRCSKTLDRPRAWWAEPQTSLSCGPCPRSPLGKGDDLPGKQPTLNAPSDPPVGEAPLMKQ